MGANTTRIKGSAVFDPCVRERTWLAAHIYKIHNSDFATAYPEWVIDAVEKNWDDADKKDEHDDTGLVAVLYRSKQEDEHCNPTLVFRGTDFDDFRDLGFYAIANVYWGILNELLDIPLKFIMTHDPSSTGKFPFQEQASLQAALDAGYEQIPLINENAWVWVEGASFGLKAPVKIALQAGILGKENGDWITNVRQGLGMPARQYENAIEYGIEKAKEILAEEKALSVTGHSLGGGLASAVATVIAREVPELRLNTVTFNAAGVHPDTIKPAVPGDAVIRMFAVEDEVLTTVQSHTSHVPALASVFRIAQRRMPEALGNLMEFKGACPPSHPKLAPTEAELPNLFPLNEQTLIPNIAFKSNLQLSTPGVTTYTHLLTLNNLFAASPTILDFANSLVDYLNEHFREAAMNSLTRQNEGWNVPFTDIQVINIKQIYIRMAELARAELQPELDAFLKIMDACVAYHGMDFVIATFEKEYSTRRG